jgi:hypothetical protein
MVNIHVENEALLLENLVKLVKAFSNVPDVRSSATCTLFTRYFIYRKTLGRNSS